MEEVSFTLRTFYSKGKPRGYIIHINRSFTGLRSHMNVSQKRKMSWLWRKPTEISSMSSR